MATVTRNHEQIRRWAEERGARPTVVSHAGGMLRFEFPPKPAKGRREVDWDAFFLVFDEKGLELVFDAMPESRFHKFVYPEATEAKAERRPAAKPAPAGKPRTAPRSNRKHAA